MRRRTRRSAYSSRPRTDRNDYQQGNYPSPNPSDDIVYSGDKFGWTDRVEGFRRRERRDGWLDRRDNRNFVERPENRDEEMWSRMSNNDDRDFASERERDSLERELGHGSRGGFGYSRYNGDGYMDTRSIDDDITDYGGYSGYNEERSGQGFDDTRYAHESGYSDPWRGERNLPERRPRRSRRRREYQR